MMRVLKDNILVKSLPILNKNAKIKQDNNNVKRNVDNRLNCGIVVAVSRKTEGVIVGDVVGYSTLDGVNVKFLKESYILLSKRETQAVILDPIYDNVKFGLHNREDANEIYVGRKIEGGHGALL